MFDVFLVLHWHFIANAPGSGVYHLAGLPLGQGRRQWISGV